MKLRKLNRSPIAVAVVLAMIFALLLYCNLKTNLVADDYRYCFSFADDTRMESLSQLIPSMLAHRVSMNGRLIAHSLVQIFLMLPPMLFKLCNAGIFTLLIGLVYALSRRGREHNALLCAAIFGAVWVLQPQFGQVFLWLDGSVNYLWCGVLCLLWLWPWVRHFLDGETLHGWRLAAYCVFSLIVGGYSENSTVALVCMALVLLLLVIFYKKQKITINAVLPLAFMLVGFLLMLLTPGEVSNKSAGSFAALLQNVGSTFAVYVNFLPLLVVYALLLWLSYKKKRERELRILSLVFLCGSLAGHFVLCFALYCAGRSTYIALILLLCACALLLYDLFDTDAMPLMAAVCVLCLCFTAYFGYKGVRDILRTNYLLTFNEEIITEAAANGERNVQLPRPYAQTKYSALDGLPYLELDRTDDWSNKYMALYYGVDTVIGY